MEWRLAAALASIEEQALGTADHACSRTKSSVFKAHRYDLLVTALPGCQNVRAGETSHSFGHVGAALASIWIAPATL